MKIFRKIMAIAIIGLFIGAGVLPSINGDITRDECDYRLNATDTPNKCCMWPPWVTTGFATNVDPWGNHATLNGALLSRGGYDYCDVWFVWDTQYHVFFLDYAHSTSKIKKSNLGFFDTTITGLVRGQTYYFRAVADNGESHDQGVSLTFIPGYPWISTLDASSISTTNARLNGRVEDTGGVDCEVWFVYDTSSHNIYSDYKYKTPIQHKNSIGDVSNEITNLQQNTKYYFQAVISNDVGTSSGFEVNFTTKSGINNPPNIPSDPYPENGEINVPTDTQINWISDDPDGDPVTYDIYFSEENPPQKIQSNFTTNIFSPEELEYNKLYFWQIVAWDINGASSYGPIWSFSTEIDISPPNPPMITGPSKGTVDTSTDYNFRAIDPEDHEVYYFIDWGDGTNSGWIGHYISGEQITESHIWSTKGTYMVRAKAKDIAGHESDWATLEISIPKNKSFNTPFLNFLENHPRLFPLLRLLLNLQAIQ